MFFSYPSPQEANSFVNIDSVVDLKVDAALKQVEPVRARRDQVPAGSGLRGPGEGGGGVEETADAGGTATTLEAFRRATGFIQK